MNSLRDRLQRAQQNHEAVGHFNVSDLVVLKAVFAAAQELNVPVIVGLSEGEREFVGTGQIAAFVRNLREEYDFHERGAHSRRRCLVGRYGCARAGEGNRLGRQ